MTEGPSNPVFRKQIPPGLQFLILIGLFLFIWFAGNAIGVIVVMAEYGRNILGDIEKMNMSAAHVSSALWLLQFFGTTLPILAAPLIFSYFIVREPAEYLKNDFHFPWLTIVVVFLIMILASPLMEYIGLVNQKIPLAQWMIDYENSLKKYSDNMMQMNTFSSMVFDLIFIGLLTAVVEEILFRGCIQTIFTRWTRNTHVAIWITAILFSAFHMEFSGFLPRMFLGLLFGYFTAWSGSVWPAIWAHFVNNGTVVVWFYLYQNKLTGINPETPQLFNNLGYVISFVLTLLLLFFYKYISDKWHESHHGEELD